MACAGALASEGPGIGVTAVGAGLSVFVDEADSALVACRATCGSPPRAAMIAKGKALLVPPVGTSTNALPADASSVCRRHIITGLSMPDEAVRISAATALRWSTTSLGALAAEAALLTDCRCTSGKEADDSTCAGTVSLPARPVRSATV